MYFYNDFSSNKYSLHERQTKRGKVYDVRFRIITLDGTEKQKKLSGYANKLLAKQAYFVMAFQTTCAKLKSQNAAFKKPQYSFGQEKNLINLYLS